MPTTPIFALRYPTSANAANVPLDIQNLATDVDNNLNTVNTALGGRVTTLETPPIFRARLHATGTVPNNTPTNITWDTFDIDTHSMKNNNTEIKCQRAGYYHVHFGLAFAAGIANRAALRVYKALAATPTVFNPVFIGRIHPSASSAENGINAVGVVQLAVNDLLRFIVSQDSGSSQSTIDLEYSPTFAELIWIRA